MSEYATFNTSKDEDPGMDFGIFTAWLGAGFLIGILGGLLYLLAVCQGWI
jgi:hypothetical protein